ncbi:microcephalin isoform X2 [Etheostoma cragini]|uniref:microcephalin isoform X2 n=1 Tax=Etheostoma cragini TaxID=417921 RepID=UPI00155EB323|nr:microcephalin isoform X2 [Etheostoma cragini]
MTTSNKCSALKDVVAYVDVWSSDKTANYSKPFVQQLQEMGAQVSKTFSKQVTHVVFNNGHPATWRNAKKSGVRLVSVLWVGRCYDDGVCVDEDLFPAFNDESNPLLKNKKHRCMQPKDSPERTPENDRRMRKKLDKLMKDIVPKQPLVTDVSPIFIDEENGIVYSPALKRSDYMAQRLKDMKEKRENLSLTASQMVESCSPTGLKPSLGSTPPVFKLMYDQSDDESSASVAAPAYLPDKEERRTQFDVTDHDRLEQCNRKSSKKPWLSPRHDVPKRISSSVKFPDLNDKEDDEVNRQKDSIRTSVRKKPAEKHKSIGLLESPCQDRGSDNSKNFHKEKRQSKIKSSSPPPNNSEKGMRKIKALTETKTHFFPEAASSCRSSPSKLVDAAVELSKETSTPLQKIPKRARASISSLVQSFTLSVDPKSVASCSTDGDDVFEDFFSPANHQRLPLSNLPMKTDIQIPFELDSVPKKRKQRRSSSIVSETDSKKKRKLETSQQSDASSEPQSHPQQDVKESLPALESPSGDVAIIIKRQRQSTLSFTSTRTTTSETVKQRRTSTSVQPIMFTNAISELQKNSDVNVPSHTLESKGNAHTAAAVLTEIHSEGEEENHNKKVSLSHQNMVNKTKAMRTLVMTSMPTEKQHTLAQVVTALGGFSIVDRVCESTTHVVSGGQRRTLNILLGIARGCWILSFEWILWCLEQRKWIPEEPYELSDQFPAAQHFVLSPDKGRNLKLVLQTPFITSQWKEVKKASGIRDLSSPEAPVCWGAPAGPVPRPASDVCVPSLTATHSVSGGADPALWGNSLQNCATGWYLHREIQRQETRGKQDPV